MSIYKNQAQRVIDHIAKDTQLSIPDLRRLLKIGLEGIEIKIQEMVLRSQGKLNGKKAADLIIDLWMKNHPDYVNQNYKIVYIYKDQEFRFKFLPDAVHIFYNGPAGEYLHHVKLFLGTNTESKDYRDRLCADTLDAYEKKVEKIENEENEHNTSISESGESAK